MQRILERCSLALEGMAASVEPAEDVVRITGYGSVFGNWFDAYGVKTRVAAGAFSKTLKEATNIRGMFNHNPDYLLGTTESGTMDVAEDAKGLKYEIRADAKDPQAVSVTRKIARGLVKGSSIMFSTHREEWQRDEKTGRPTHRTIHEVELIEAGPVVMPANPKATAKIKHAANPNEIDYESLTGLLVMHRAGFQLSTEELNLVDLTIEALKRLKSAPASEGHPDTGTAPVHKRRIAAAWAQWRRSARIPQGEATA